MDFECKERYLHILIVNDQECCFEQSLWFFHNLFLSGRIIMGLFGKVVPKTAGNYQIVQFHFLIWSVSVTPISVTGHE